MKNKNAREMNTCALNYCPNGYLICHFTFNDYVSALYSTKKNEKVNWPMFPNSDCWVNWYLNKNTKEHIWVGTLEHPHTDTINIECL